MSVVIKGMAMPKNCFRCPILHWYDSGYTVGFRCGALKDVKIISNCAGRSSRREDCLIMEVDHETK